MPRPLARSLTRAAAATPAASARRLSPAPVLTVVSGAGAKLFLRGRPRDRDSAPRPRENRRRSAALAIDAKRAMRAATLRDCGRRCVYCATALSFDTVTLDHVYPRSLGGPNIAGNVVAACGPCNRLKADVLPSEFFLRHPWAGLNFMRLARTVHRSLKRGARRAVSLAYAGAPAVDEAYQRAPERAAGLRAAA